MFKAIKTFAGINVAMKKGDTREYIEQDVAEDLLRAGYIEEIKESPVVKETTSAKIAQVQKEEVVEAIKEVEKPKKTTTRKKK